MTTAVKSFDEFAAEPRPARHKPLVPARASHTDWRELLVCAAVFGLLVASLLTFRYSGDGDAVLHYLNARDAYLKPSAALHSWSRPMFKLLIALPAWHGVVAVRVYIALMSTFIAWQAVRLAKSLGMANAFLAGLLLIWQPMAFSLMSDTMSEMPMALGIILALRLWLGGWHFASCLVLGFLPAVRPEGFFLGVLWGMLVLFAPGAGSWLRRGLMLPVLAIGMGCWVFACWYWTGDPIWFITIWNWPFKSYEAYGRGSIFHYLINWPGYCGPVLLVLFVAGVRPALRRKGMLLPAGVLGLVFLIHTILYWRGWFASCGLVRIMAAASPVTALICLEGWNAIGNQLHESGWSSIQLRRLAWGAGVLATFWIVAVQATDAGHRDGRSIHLCTQFILDHHLVKQGDSFFAGNLIVNADLGFPPNYLNSMETPCDTPKIRENLAALPIGAIGVWDNRQAPIWHGITIDEMAASGFTILFDVHDRVHARNHHLVAGGTVDYRYAVLRKDGPFPTTRPARFSR